MKEGVSMKTVILYFGIGLLILYAIGLYCCIKLSGSLEKQIENNKVEE